MPRKKLLIQFKCGLCKRSSAHHTSEWKSGDAVRCLWCGNGHILTPEEEKGLGLPSE